MLLQATPTPAISIAQLLNFSVIALTIITMLIGLLAGAYKLGGLNARITASDERVTKTLEQILAQLDGWAMWRTDFTGWRAQITEQVEQIERRHRTEPGSPHRRAGDT